MAEDGSPRLLDFGIAKLLNPELAGQAPTATAMAMTPEYANPEQARGERITTASDVYSLTSTRWGWCSTSCSRATTPTG